MAEAPHMDPTEEEYEQLRQESAWALLNLPDDGSVAPKDVESSKRERKYLPSFYKGHQLFAVGKRLYVDKNNGHFSLLDHELGPGIKLEKLLLLWQLFI